jgi:hypothetical protein
MHTLGSTARQDVQVEGEKLVATSYRFLKHAACSVGAAILLSASADAAPEPVAVFEDGQSAPTPAISRTIGEVRTHICRRAWDATPLKEEAVAAIRERATVLRANGVISVRFDRTRTSLTDRKCWQRLAVSGDAVVFAPSPGR